MAAQPSTKMTLGEGPGSAVTDRVPMMMITRFAADVMFVAVLEPVLPASKPRVADVSLDKTDSKLTVTIHRGPQTDTVILFGNNQLTVRAADKEVFTAD